MSARFLLAFVCQAAALRLEASLAHRPSRAALSRRSGFISCGWGPDPVWSELKVAHTADEAEGLKAISIEVPAETAAGYTTPGQYVQLRAPGAEKVGFFAIACAPTAAQEGKFEFLIKESESSSWLTKLAAGGKLECSQVMGGGFKMTEQFDGPTYDFPCLQALLFAAGSGIAPIRAAIEEPNMGLKMKEGRRAKLYYGVETPAKLAYESKFDEWKSLGLEVIPVVSKPEGTGWKGATGYVQDVARAQGIETPRNSGVLLCGMKGMAEGVKELAKDVGIFEGRVLTNF